MTDPQELRFALVEVFKGRRTGGPGDMTDDELDDAITYISDAELRALVREHGRDIDAIADAIGVVP